MSIFVQALSKNKVAQLKIKKKMIALGKPVENLTLAMIVDFLKEYNIDTVNGDINTALDTLENCR